MEKQKHLEWKTRLDDISPKVHKLEAVETVEHPLKIASFPERIPRRILGSQANTGLSTPIGTPSAILEPLSVALEGIDPLTAFVIEEMDPLSKIAADESKTKKNSNPDFKKELHTESDLWSSQKALILSRFTTSEKISIVTSFLSDVIVRPQTTAVDKVQHRLEQLDSFEDSQQTKLDLSQSEYIKRIDQLNKELISAWNSEQRVKSLKIAIQCAKLLSDISVLTFYPSKFVLITDILDTFGQLVYTRLCTKPDTHKSVGKVSKLPEDFTPDLVSESTKETCLNWFYKIASIRELVPRLYVEMALVKSYCFLSLSDCEEALNRLAHITSGIGNPLVAIYARCYLARAGQNLSKRLKNQHFRIQNLQRFFRSYHYLFSKSLRLELQQQKMSFSVYLTLLSPALQYILQTMTESGTETLLEELLEKCKTLNNSSLILTTTMAAFKPSIISARTLQFLELMENYNEDDIPLHSMLRTLGLCTGVSPPPTEQRKQILNIVWKHIFTLTSTEEYMNCVETWILFVAKNFSNRELNSILGDIIKHLSTSEKTDSYHNQLKLIIDNIILNTQDFEALIAMENFLPLIDLFPDEALRVEICKKVLISYCSNVNFINDPVVVNAIMFFCSILHDSINALTPEDEFRQIGDILCNVIRIIDYGRDFEQQLNFYVEARGLFSNIDMVNVQLIHCVNTLSASTRQIVKGLHTRKTADFVRACSAYCFITIASIKSVKHRLRLYLLSGQVALYNLCLGQADACFKGALTTIPEIDNSSSSNLTEEELISFIRQFLGVLLVVPDNPDTSVLYLTRSLLNILQRHSWSNPTSLIKIYLNVIDVLCAAAQECYPYHIDRVESNDTLYGSDIKFIGEVDKMCSVVLRQIETKIRELGSSSEKTALILQLFEKFLVKTEFTDPTTSFALNLWNGLSKSSQLDTKFFIRTKKHIKTRLLSIEDIRVQEIAKKIE